MTLSSRTLNTVGEAVMITENHGRRGECDHLCLGISGGEGSI